MKYCYKCGTAMEDYTNFCTKCGTTFIVPTPSAPATPHQAPNAYITPTNDYVHNMPTRSHEDSGGKKQRKNAIIAFLITLVIGLVILNVFQYTQFSNELSSKNGEIRKLNAEAADAELSEGKLTVEQWKEKKNAEERIVNLETQISQYKDKVEFLDKNIVIISSTTPELYHKYGCSNLDFTEYIVATEKSAQNDGFSPCPNCCHKAGS